MLVYLTLGQGQEALNILNSAQETVKTNEEKALFYLAKGTTYIVLGDEMQAKELYKIALQLDPKNKIIKSNIEILED